MLLSAGSVMAQSGMTDDQVMSFVAKEHSAGTSNSHIVTKPMQRGVDISQIRRVREKYEKMQRARFFWPVLPTAQEIQVVCAAIMARHVPTMENSPTKVAHYSNYHGGPAPARLILTDTLRQQ